MSTPFSSACGVSISNNYDTVGSLTRATIKGLSPTQVQALFTDGTQFHEMSAMLKTQFEMRACGVRRYGFYDWIMSSNRPGMGKLIQTVKRDKGDSLIQPFIMGRQNSVVNADYWVVSNGYPVSGGGTYVATVTGPLAALTGGDRVIRVLAGYSVPLDVKYFLPQHQLHILNRIGGAAKHGQWKVVDAALAGDGSYVDVLVASLNSFDTSTVDLTPTTGVVLIGTNNVNDYEKWCYNNVTVNPVKWVPFWYSQRRRGRRVDSAYLELFAKLMDDNEWFAQFQDLPMAERNRQDELTDMKQYVNSFLFSRPWSNAQRLEGSPNWTSLPQIASLSGAQIDPGTGGQLQAYRANMVGVYPQLQACGSTYDLQNQVLDMANFCEVKLYDVWRSRISQGRKADELDIYTDSTTADQWMVGFIAYAKAKLGDIVRINIEEGKDVEFGFTWRKFKLFKPQGVTVNIIVNEFFDDISNTFANLPGGSQESRGRFLALLDLGKGGSIYPAVLGSNRRTYETGQIELLAKIDPTYACVMENPTFKTSLTSEIDTAVVECPLHSLWTENFSSVAYVPPA